MSVLLSQTLRSFPRKREFRLFALALAAVLATSVLAQPLDLSGKTVTLAIDKAGTLISRITQ
jgi:hypothetical protein